MRQPELPGRAAARRVVGHNLLHDTSRATQVELGQANATTRSVSVAALANYTKEATNGSKRITIQL